MTNNENDENDENDEFNEFDEMKMCKLTAGLSFGHVGQSDPIQS
jgi:hypothetical protein